LGWTYAENQDVNWLKYGSSGFGFRWAYPPHPKSPKPNQRNPLLLLRLTRLTRLTWTDTFRTQWVGRFGSISQFFSSPNCYYWFPIQPIWCLLWLFCFDSNYFELLLSWLFTLIKVSMNHICLFLLPFFNMNSSKKRFRILIYHVWVVYVESKMWGSSHHSYSNKFYFI